MSIQYSGPSTQYQSLPPRGEYAGFGESGGRGAHGLRDAAPLPPPSLRSAQGPSPLDIDRSDPWSMNTDGSVYIDLRGDRPEVLL